MQEVDVLIRGKIYERCQSGALDSSKEGLLAGEMGEDQEEEQQIVGGDLLLFKQSLQLSMRAEILTQQNAFFSHVKPKKYLSIDADGSSNFV